MYPPSSLPTSDLAMAIMSLRPLVVDPHIDVLARSPDGIVDFRINGEDGSYIALKLRVPPCFEATPKLRILDLHAWSEPVSMYLQPFEPGEGDERVRFLMLCFIDYCKAAVMEALGPSARHTTWWN